MTTDRIVKFKRGARIKMSELEAAAKASMFGTENPGFCLACGEQRDGCEPDARGYECYGCNEMAVSGAEDILFMLL